MFRQFPAHSADGESYIIIEFRDGDGSDANADHPSPRYELSDGRRLIRHGQHYLSEDGNLRLDAS